MKKLLLLAFTLVLTTVGFTSAAFAADPTTNCGTNPAPQTATVNQNPQAGPVTETVPRQCDPALTTNDCSNVNVSDSNCTLLGSYIQPAVDLLSVLFGIAVVGAIIYGGIEYSSSGGDPSKASAGKNRIRNALVALVGYVFLVAALNFIIPGGLF